MKRLNLIALALLVSASSAFAGGLVTNTNQSAAWARTLSRNATLDVDAVYFNPAGLSQLSSGLHLSISNQSIWQTRTITNDYRDLNDVPTTYEAELVAPIFPSIYAAYQWKKWTFSAGFNVIGGGGSADFPTGLPTFEIPVASIPTILEAMVGPNPPIESYNMKASFNGSSMYMGYQLGASYAINDMFSVALGGRLVTASNSYEGALTDITLNVPAFGSDPVTAGNYLRGIASMLDPNDPTQAPIIPVLMAGADTMDVKTADQHLNATQSGTGFTPFIGVNVKLNDKINLAAKYEFHTKMELTNKTEVDDVGMFPDGEKTRADLPAMLALGAEVKILKNLTATGSFNYFFDKSAYYGNVGDDDEQVDNESTIDENGFTWGVSLEYRFLKILGISAGYNGGNNGVNSTYQSDLSYALKSQTVGGGLFVDIGEMVTINAGIAFTTYEDLSNPGSYTPEGFPPEAAVNYNTTYAKDNMIFAIGVDLSF